MTTTQKVIKNLAIGFAIFLIITIISTSITVFFGIAGIFGLKKDKNIENEEMIITSFENNIKNIEIDVAYTSLILKTGEKLTIETSSSDITCKENNDTIKIKEKNHNWFSKNDNQEIIIYVPENLHFDKVEINAGAGKINIENLVAKKLSFELGAGETKIEKLNVTDSCNIEGGAGKIEIKSGIINDLNLDLGVGETNLTAALIGKNKINAGIGSLKINLQENKEMYKIDANKGIGTIKIEGKDISSGETYGDGDRILKIDGGIGNITVDFE